MEKSRIETEPKAKISLITATPFLTSEKFNSLTEKQDAVVFIVFASGASPDRLNSIIEKRIKEDIPVFLVSNNPGDKNGILRIVYTLQFNSLKAGAIPIEKVNINNIDRILAEIQKQFSLGKKGKELGEAIKEVFSYKKNEERPSFERESPEEIQKLRQFTKYALMRVGIKSKEEIEAELKKMGF